MIEKIKKHPAILLFSVFWIITLGIIFHDYYILVKQPIWVDEYVFLKVTKNLPDYSSNKEWIEEKNDVFKVNINDPLYDAAYTTKVWGHPPIANIIMYPVAIGFSDDGLINNIWLFRLVYVIILIVTIWLIVDVIRRKFGLLVASISMMPIMLSQYLLAASIYVYYDGWMCLLIALTLWIVEVKKDSKWKYVSAVALGLSKIYAIAFIIPIAILEYRKNGIKNGLLMLCTMLGLVAFLGYQWMVTGDVKYIFSDHWLISNQWNYETFRVVVLPNIGSIIKDWGLYIHVPLVVFGIMLWVRRFRWLDYSYIVLYGMVVVFAINGGLMGNKTYPIMLFAMPMMIPIAQKIITRTRSKNINNNKLEV